MKNSLYLLSILLFVFSSCLLQRPEARFENFYLSKQLGVSAGDTLKLYNDSQHADSYKWTVVSTGETFTTKDLVYIVPVSTTPNSQFSVKLEAYNKTHRRKPGTLTRDVLINPAQCKVAFWGKAGAATQYNYIVVDGNANYDGGIQYPTLNQPIYGSGNSYAEIYNIQNWAYGSHHTYTASNGTNTITGSFDISSLITYVQVY